MYHDLLLKIKKKEVFHLNKIDLESAQLSLKGIVSALGLILEDLEEEHASSEGIEKAFVARVESVYMPALDLIQYSAVDLLKQMEASI